MRQAIKHVVTLPDETKKKKKKKKQKRNGPQISLDFSDHCTKKTTKTLKKKNPNLTKYLISF